ncbi:MAG: L-serine ammonia-lyase [Desulfovibrionaceae bacterium]
MPPIALSLFDLFKVGPGPSSSHTIGPMKAGTNFLRLARLLPEDALRHAGRVEVRLFGSLSATGKGHGTDRAVLAGLSGQEPETCPPDLLGSMGEDAVLEMDLGCTRLPLRLSDVHFGPLAHDFPYNNTLLIELRTGKNTDERLLTAREYYSVGGGFLQWKGWRPPARGIPLHTFHNATEALAVCRAKGLTLDRLMLENEMALTGADEASIMDGLRGILAAMEHAVDHGLRAEGRLPGPIGLTRKAKALLERAASVAPGDGKLLYAINAYALAASEENAAGGTIVTAPTAGAAGVVPAMAVAMRRDLGMDEDAVLKGLMAAGLVGMLCKCNASIAGAEVGCQGEVGVASAMAAALLSHGSGLGLPQVENAAETALEHHLGMTCDPVGGYVQIPCIERNAMGAVKALNAHLIATALAPEAHKVTLDSAIAAMAATGKDMLTAYKETALGGLAVAWTEC